MSGSWDVERTGGLLPPLLGVGKVIEGDRGWTTLLGRRVVPFDVVGLELRYSPPFRAFVDVLSPEGRASYSGRATVAGRTVGTFRMTRIPQATTPPRTREGGHDGR